jgi:hypothetical protein
MATLSGLSEAGLRRLCAAMEKATKWDEEDDTMLTKERLTTKLECMVQWVELMADLDDLPQTTKETTEKQKKKKKMDMEMSDVAQEISSFLIQEKNENEPKEVIFSIFFNAFKDTWRSSKCTEAEFYTFIKHTTAEHGNERWYLFNGGRLDDIDIFNEASFVIDIPNLADNSPNMKALWVLVKTLNNVKLRDARFEHPVMQFTANRTRLSFTYKPGGWELFQKAVKIITCEHKFDVLRVLLCSTKNNKDARWVDPDELWDEEWWKQEVMPPVQPLR